MPDAAIAQSLPRAEAGVGGDLRQIPPAQPDAPETKHERFLRLTGKRMQKTLHGLDQLANLSGPIYEAQTQHSCHQMQSSG